MPQGKVKFFNVDKGFGFIVPEEGGKDAFVHMRDVRDSGLEPLEAGQQVSYDLKEVKEKRVAVNIKLLS